MRALVRWVAALLVLVLLGGGGYYFWRQRTVQAAARQRPRFVTAEVRRGNVESVVTGTGPVASINGVQVRANVTGTVVKLNAQDGDQVKANTVVVELANEATVAALAQAQLDYDKARADLANLLNPEATALRAAELKLSGAQLTLRQRQTDVANLKVTAPCACVVVDVKAVEGDGVANNALLMTLYDDARPSVVANFSQAFAPYIRPGQTADVIVSGMGARQAAVALVGTVAATGARDATVPVTLTLPAWFGVRPGMLATVSLVPDLDPNLGVVQVSGSVAAADIQEVRAKVAADAVVQLPVRAGDRVNRGDLLAELKNDTLQQQMQQAENDVALQELNLANLKNPLADPAGQARQLQARVASSEITLRARQSDVEDLTVEAPVDGQISSLNLRVGDRITTNTALFRVADYTALQVDINVDELDIAKVKVGTPATVTLDALPGQTFRAKVLKINPEGVFRNDIANFIVTVKFEETRGLMAGMNATVNIQVARRENVLRAPAQAVQVRGGRATVRVEKDGQAVQVPVQVGLRTAEWVEVTEGLKEGDKIILAEVRQNNQQSGFGFFGGGGGPGAGQPAGVVPGAPVMIQGGGGGGVPGGGGIPGGGQIRQPEGGRR